MGKQINQINEQTASPLPLKKELEKKIKFVSKMVLFIALFGFLTYALFEYFFGIYEVFIAGLITCAALLLPTLLVFLNKVKAGMILFIITMTGAMVSTQFFYINDAEFLGLMMVDFSVYFGLIITSGFILNEKRYVFIVVIISAVFNGLITAYYASGITMETKRFFLIELFVFLAIGFLVYYFNYLYNAFLKKARMEMEKQLNTTKKLIELNKSFERFVPNTFLNLLNKKSITQVRLGDQIQMNMTVMFADIRSFTTLSEKMTPKENFEFLNSLLKIIGPTIRHFHGFIDKYIGDAVLSLYPEKVDHAVMTAIEIQKLFAMFNLVQMKKKKSSVKIGVGINSGDVIAGIIGEEERMEETVISDTVNIASRLESLTKLYGADILISENALEEMEKKDSFHFRFLDQIQAQGKILPIAVFEVLDCDDEVKKKHFELRATYKEGWDFFCDGRIKEAVQKFEYILSLDPADKASKYQLKRCRDFMND